MFVILLASFVACGNDVVIEGIELPPSVTSCSKPRSTWYCKAGDFEIGLSVSHFGLLTGAPKSHPVAQCTSNTLSLESGTMLNQHCRLDETRFRKTVKWADNQDRTVEATALLDAIRFDALEKACVAKTGEPCPDR